jgi:arylsulfatase A-like enzyme
MSRGWIALLLVAAAWAPAGAQDKKPNVLFIMSDDHTVQAIGAYGSRLAGINPTPVIDSLARNGMRFDRVFCNNSICAPSRASIITGQYSQTNGVIDLGGAVAPDRQYLPIEMKNRYANPAAASSEADAGGGG